MDNKNIDFLRSEMGCTKRKDWLTSRLEVFIVLSQVPWECWLLRYLAKFCRLGGYGFLYKTIQRRILLGELVEKDIPPSIIEEWPIVTMMIHSCDNCY